MPTGRDAAASVVARTRADNTGLTRGMQEADRIVRQGAQQMQRTASTSGAGVGDAFAQGMLRAVGVSLGVGGALRIAGATMELAEYGAQVDRVRTSYENLAQTDATPMLQKLRDMSHGTIDDMNLMLSANKAMMLGVTQDTETMARLMEIAMVRGRAMGLSTQQAFNDLVTGLGRASPMILDNLGIVTGGVRTFEEYAQVLGKTADELTEVEKRQALLNKVLQESSGQAAPDAAGGFEALDAQAKNVKASWGMGLGNVFGPIAQDIADFLRSAQESQAILKPYTDTLEEMKAHMPTAEYQALRAEVYAASKAWDTGALSVDEYTALLNKLLPGVDKTTVTMQLAETATLRKEQADMRAAQAAGIHANAANGLTAALSAQLGMVNDLVAVYGSASWQRAWRDLQYTRLGGDPAKELRFLMDELKGMKVGSEEWVDQLTAIERAKQRVMGMGTTGTARGIGGGGISDAQRLAEQRAREFESLVQSVLQPTQVTGADVSATEHGAYVDKWDEYIRRLRADQSIPYYQRMETERQFYSGQMLDQVNWDAVIQDIARKQQEEAGRQNLLNEAMRRAQEAGLAANYADVAASLGIRDDTVTGAEAAQAFEEGAKSVDVAAGVVEQFVEGVRAQRQAMVDAGAESMRAFLEGSDQAITPDAGKKFARRIVPFIYDEFKAQGML